MSVRLAALGFVQKQRWRIGLVLGTPAHLRLALACRAVAPAPADSEPSESSLLQPPTRESPSDNGGFLSRYPVQNPAKFELVKTAKTFDLTLPQTPLATADEVIE